MDLFIINASITNGIGNLTGFHSGNRLCHRSKIFLTILFRNKTDHCGNSLWNRLRRHYNNFLVFCQISCLICCKNDIFIIRENVNRFCIYFFNGIEHIFCTWIHSLTTFNQVIYAKFTENLRKSLSYGYRNKSVFFRWLFLLLGLFSGKFLCIFDQFLLMLLAHIVNFHTGKLSICECTFKCLSRMICVYMDLYNFIVCYQYNGISNRIQEFTEAVDFFLRKRFLKKNDKFCTISKFNISLSLRRNLGYFRSSRCLELGIIHLFPMVSVNGSTKNLQKSLSAGIHNTCFFQNREHFRSSGKRFLCMLKNPIKK